ncbi:hypothetical protein ABES03_08645 [Neobacillus rhizosphaerae]|uniref:hypothetical protein n=1 Tax=Neobacillus rhizosphaerae TaxID=2880965 RepID=UPI003D26C4CD
MFVKNMFPTPFMNADGGQAGGGNNEQPTNNAGQTPDNAGANNTQNAHEPGKDASQHKETMIPKSRFDEVNNKMKELQDQLEKFTKQKEQEELEAKKKKGEFEKLYNDASTELESVKGQFKNASERVEALEGLIQTLVDAELEAVPEELRDLVPENFTPEQKLSWITNAKKKGLFGATQQNSKEEQELGGATNNQAQQQPIEIGKMSVTQLFRSAYGSK